MDVSLSGSCHGYSTILHGAHFHHKLLHIYIQTVWAHFSNFFLKRATRIALKENSVFGPEHSDGPAAPGIIR